MSRAIALHHVFCDHLILPLSKIWWWRRPTETRDTVAGIIGKEKFTWRQSWNISLKLLFQIAPSTRKHYNAIDDIHIEKTIKSHQEIEHHLPTWKNWVVSVNSSNISFWMHDWTRKKKNKLIPEIINQTVEIREVLCWHERHDLQASWLLMLRCCYGSVTIKADRLRKSVTDHHRTSVRSDRVFESSAFDLSKCPSHLSSMEKQITADGKLASPDSDISGSNESRSKSEITVCVEAAISKTDRVVLCSPRRANIS